MGTQTGHKRAKGDTPRTPIDEKLYRAVLTINEADALSPKDRYKIVNWMHGIANDLGHDDHMALPPVYKVWMMK